MAEGQTRPDSNATEVGTKKPGNGFQIGGIAIIALTIVFFFAALAFGLFGASSQVSGATPPQSINVAAPSAEEKKLLATFSQVTDAADFLRKNSQALTNYQTNLTLLAEKLRNNDPAYASITKKADMLTLIDTMLGQITTIQSQVGAGATDATAKLASDLLANAHKLDQLANPSIVDIAMKYASDNAASGYTLYKYDQKQRDQIVETGKGYSDCSSFVSAMLYQSGITRVKVNYDTVTLYAAAKAAKSGFHIVKEAPTAAGFSLSDAMGILQPGDIILSADKQYPNLSETDGDSTKHTVIYVGNGTVVESGGNKGNIHTQTLAARVSGGHPLQVIIRADGQ